LGEPLGSNPIPLNAIPISLYIDLYRVEDGKSQSAGDSPKNLLLRRNGKTTTHALFEDLAPPSGCIAETESGVVE
jgi:hypothetical protein